VGYGDIHAVTTMERLCTIFIMLISAALYAYNINEVSYLVSRYNVLAASYMYSLFAL
jgi:Ion channel